ncbi:MAG: TetR family transcriptional regulator [Bacilli bacterium]|nr:TetR family transcriptional regulator [Bacilli bacterium]
MKKKEDLRIIKTKKNLYEGLLQLMKDTSFEDIKVSDICNVSLVNRSTFYDHFSDKYELLATLIDDLEEELSENLENNQTFESAKDYYMSMIRILFQHISDNIEIYSSIIKTNNNGIASDMFREAILKDVRKTLDKSTILRVNVPVDVISIFYVSAVINVCIEYIREPGKYTMQEILDYLDKLIPNDIYFDNIKTTPIEV